jgi:hypothetical protein
LRGLSLCQVRGVVKQEKTAAIIRQKTVDPNVVVLLYELLFFEEPAFLESQSQLFRPKKDIIGQFYLLLGWDWQRRDVSNFEWQAGIGET